MRVVIVDLGGAIIDEGFGAASLEQVLDAVEGWGAEPILAGISPLSERAVADLERTPPRDPQGSARGDREPPSRSPTRSATA